MLAPIISDPAFYAVRILIGLTALIFVATTWLGPARPKPAQSGIVSGLFWGTVSGFLSFASQGGGPPFQVFTLPQRLSKMTFVGTTAIFFAALNIIKIVHTLCWRSLR